jgi:hypothetical protein
VPIRNPRWSSPQDIVEVKETTLAIRIKIYNLVSDTGFGESLVIIFTLVDTKPIVGLLYI